MNQAISMSTKLDLRSALNSLDLFIFFFILLLTLLIVLWGKFSKQKNSIHETLLMSRKLTLPLFITTLVATWYGGIIGVTEIAFTNGIYSWISQGVFWYVTYLIFAFFILPKIHTRSAATLPEWIGLQYGPYSRKLTSYFSLISLLPIAYTLSLGLFLQALFGGELYWNALIGMTFVTLYASHGGFRSVVFSDFIQFFVMCASVAFVIFFSFSTFGGLSFLKVHLPDTYFQMQGNESWGSLFAWGLVALGTLVDPSFYHRCFASNDVKTAKKGILWATLIWVLFDFCTTFGAMYAKAVLPSASPAQAYLNYSIQLLPHGLRGFFLAGVLATILSTLDSFLFLAGVALSYDSGFIQKFNMRKQTVSFIFIAAISLLLLPLFDQKVHEIWMFVGSLNVGCLFFPIVADRVFGKTLSDKEFCILVLICALSMIFISVPFEKIYLGLAVSFTGWMAILLKKRMLSS